MFSKKDLEEREERFLKPYAQLSKYSKGRLYPEPEAESRTEYQRDRDRVIHSKAFRRLKHKTQVFVTTTEGDHYRTRLSHTLEVAQIARHLARVLGVNEDLAETIALAHDLGHTPFGHAGEKVLDELMSEYGGFEHNRQSKKIVEKLERKYPGFNGLNLTYEVLDGLVKHRSPYDHTSQEQSPSLEAQLVNLADEIAYNSHDLDDALTAGLLEHKQLEKVSLWASLSERHKEQYPKINLKLLQSLNVRALINEQIQDVLLETERRIELHNIQTREDVYKQKQNLVDFSEEFAVKIKELREFLYVNFYNHPQVLKRNKRAEKIIRKIFKYLLKHPQKIQDSSMYLEESTLPEAVADYIAGMTDLFAEKFYKSI